MTEPQISITIRLDQADAAALEIPIETVGRHRGLDRDATIALILALGAVSALADIRERLKCQIDYAEGLKKMKAGEDVPLEEAAAVFSAATGGDVAAKIILDDYKRFGRSMEKTELPKKTPSDQ
jgi:hypothetical protein